MIFRRSRWNHLPLRLSLLAAAAVLPLSVAAQTAPSAAAAPSSSNPAVQVLLKQAVYWRAQYQPAQAINSLNRALEIEPNNPDALAMLAEIQSSQGQTASAQATLAHLQAVSPGSARSAQVQQAMRIGVVGQSDLDQARQYARSGRQADAVAAYQRAFNGTTPPDNMAVEYYQTLAGVPGQWPTARQGLGAYVTANPSDLRAQLAYAQLLTYNQDARNEGIARLKVLEKESATSQQALASQRQALLWLPAEDASIPQLQEWMAAHPDDTEVAARLALARNPPPSPDDPGGPDRQKGYAAYNRGEYALADQLFQSALTKRANDADAYGGLGLVLQRQGKNAEARQDFQRAIELDPEHRNRWTPMLTSNFNTPAEWARVSSLNASGQYASALALLNRLMAGNNNNAGVYLLRGSIESNMGRDSDAEASYRRAVQMQPGNGDALIALANLLSKERKPAEADQYYAQAASLGSPLAGKARAQQMQARAEQITDIDGQVGLYSSAVQSDPSNPWLRLALARALVKQGRPDQANAVMRVLDNTSAGSSGDGLQVRLLWANETGNGQDVARLVQRVPASQRTPDEVRLANKLAISQEIRRAVLLSDRNSDKIREKLLALAAEPDDTGDRGVLISQTLVKLGDKQGGIYAIDNALALNPDPSVDARIAYAGAFMNAGDNADAQQLVGDLDPDQPLTADQETAINGIHSGIAISTSDQLNTAGRPASAFDTLAPELEQDPTNSGLNMALSRLYQGDNQPDTALKINLALLNRNPGDFDVRRAAVQAAMSAQDFSQAEQLAEDGLRQAPSNPLAWVLAGDVAKAAGENARALHDYEVARSLRRQQLGYDDVQVRQINAQQPVRNASATTAATPRTAVASGPRAYGADDGTRASGAMPRMQNAQATGISADDPLAGTDYQRTVNSKYVNPFNDNSTAGTQPDDNALGSNVPSILSVTSPIRQPQRTVDPLSQQIQDNIDQLQDQIAPSIEMGVNMRGRSGTSGEDQLGEVGPYVTYGISPWGAGRLSVTATGEADSPGTLTANSYTPTYLGTLPFYYSDSTHTTSFSSTTSNNAGLGLDAKYALDWVTVDAGTSPIGYLEHEIVGGVTLSPKLTDSFGVTGTFERRAVTDSLLSYGGIRDPISGLEYGGVVSTHAHGGLYYSAGNTNFYLGGGWAMLRGTNVKSNVEYEGGAGGSTQVASWSTDEYKLRAGMNLIYFGYEHNLDFFTYGQGGYFSPQSFVAVSFPLTLTAKPNDRLTWSLGGNLGYQTYTEAQSNLFPNNPNLQTLEDQVVGLQNKGSTTGQTFTSYFPGQQQSGISGGLQGSIEYRVSRNFIIGAKASLDHFGNWNEADGQVYARYLFLSQ